MDALILLTFSNMFDCSRTDYYYHQIISEAAGRGSQARDGPVAYTSRLQCQLKRIADEAKEQGDSSSPCFVQRVREIDADRP